MVTEQQRLDNLIRWRDELASGKWQKCEGVAWDGLGRYCAIGVLHSSSVWLPIEFLSVYDPADVSQRDWVYRVDHVNDDNPGDNFAAVIEYINEEITRRKVALGVPVHDTESHQVAAVEYEEVAA